MILVIRDGNGLWLRKGPFTLENGAQLSIENETVAEFTGIETGIWAKILILDEIFIDLKVPRLCWRSCKAQECDARRNSTDWFVVCSHMQEINLNRFEIMQFDHEMFLRIVRHILYDSNGKVRVMDLLQLLHMYILSLIKFSSDKNMNEVHMALKKQNETIEGLDVEIIRMSENRSKKRDELTKDRRDLCTKIDKGEVDIAKCSHRFLQLFSDALTEDLKFVYIETGRLKEKIEDSEEVALTSKTEYEIKQLQETRAQLDEVIYHHSRALSVMGKLEKLLKRHNSVSNQEESECEKYCRDVERYDNDVNKPFVQLNLIKILAVSVRESLNKIQRDLQEFGESTGLESQASGIQGYSTDVLSRKSYCFQWETVGTQVHRALKENKNAKKLHQKFQYKLSKFFSKSKWQPAKYSNRVRSRASFKERSYDEKINDLLDSISDPCLHYKAVSEELQSIISNYFQMMCKLLTGDPRVETVFVSQVWICYERCIFPDIFSPDITRLYTQTHKEDMCYLQKGLSSITLEKLSLPESQRVLHTMGFISSDVMKKNLSTPGEKQDENKTTMGPPETPEKVAFKQGDQTKHIVSNDGVVLRRKNKKKDHFRKSKIIGDQLIVQSKSKKYVFHNPYFPGMEGMKLYGRPFNASFDSDDQIQPDKIFETPFGVDRAVDADVYNDGDSRATGGARRRFVLDPKYGELNVEEFQKRFAKAFHYFSEVVHSAKVPTTKLQWLYNCLKEITMVMQKYADKIPGSNLNLIGADDLLPVVILFLAFSDYNKVAEFYPQLQFLQSYLPPFLAKGQFGFTLMQFSMGFDYLLKCTRIGDGVPP